MPLLGAARAGLLLLWLPLAAAAAEFDPMFAGTNDYGNAGLLQTPTARMRDDGVLGFGVSTARPYNQAHVYLQLLPWLETTLRYTDVTTQPYASAAQFGNSQHLKDKSADFKVRLLQEGAWWPAVAAGVQDIGGTGLFSSEYLVSDFHYYQLDFSFGLGWGRLGAGGDIPNPFGVFGHHFNRPRTTPAGTAGPSNGGTVGAEVWFTGKTMGAFGGVQWQTPVKGLSLRLEYDGNDYQHEALNTRVTQALPLNAGLSYALSRNIEFGVGYERGNKLTAHIDIGVNLNHFLGPAKVSDPPVADVAPPQSAGPPPPGTILVPPASAAAPPPAPWPAATEIDLAIKLKAALAAQGLQFDGLSYVPESHELRVWFSQERYSNPARAVAHVAGVLANAAPEQVLRFTVINVQDGLETYRMTLNRADFARSASGDADLDSLLKGSLLSGPAHDSLRHADVTDGSRFPHYSWGLWPALRQSIGGPDEFYATQVWLRLDGGVAVSDHLRFDGTLGVNVWNNFDRLRQTSDSLLPHVRSDIAEYLKNGANGLVKLEGNYLWSPADDLYARASAGIFEEMYGGAAAQLLYRPYGRRWALGFDVNWLKQRGFHEQFDFRSYSVATGFVTLYYELPYYHLLAQLSAGRYLAGDKGATLDLSRRFANGVRCGVFATKTNVSAAQFGEGSFDKGFYISIPLDLFFTASTRDAATGTFRPLTRDGGQRARDGMDLYELTRDSAPSAFVDGWYQMLD